MSVPTIEEHAAAVAAAWPPLTPAQRDRLAVIFRPTSGRDRA